MHFIHNDGPGRYGDRYLTIGRDGKRLGEHLQRRWGNPGALLLLKFTVNSILNSSLDAGYQSPRRRDTSSSSLSSSFSPQRKQNDIRTP